MSSPIACRSAAASSRRLSIPSNRWSDPLESLVDSLYSFLDRFELLPACRDEPRELRRHIAAFPPTAAIPTASCSAVARLSDV